MKISLGQYLNALTVVELYHEQLKEKNKETLKGVNPVFNRALKDCKVLSPKTTIRLSKEGVLTVGNLVQWTKEDLYKLKNLGKISMRDIEDLLDYLSINYDIDLQLGMEL